jgi:translation initiation factor 1 (eIF-1/SUI1)
MTKYTFQTIVATSEVRADFTALREELKSSDKELMTAMFELASKHREELDQLVQDQQNIARGYRERSKELKAAAKVRAKELVKEMMQKEEAAEVPEVAVKVKKARKAKVVAVVESVEPEGEWSAAAEVEELAIAE